MTRPTGPGRLEMRCAECDEREKLIGFLEGEVIRLHERLAELVGEDESDGDNLPNCLVCGEPGVWTLLAGVCIDCRAESERA